MLQALGMREMIASSQRVFVSNLEKKEKKRKLRLFGRDAGLLPATWIVLWDEGAEFTEAMFLISCHAGQRLCCGKFSSTLFLFNLPFFYGALHLSVYPLFFSDLMPMKNTLYFEFFCSLWFSTHLKTAWE